MTERVAPTYNNPNSPNRIILALAESNAQLSKSLLNLLSQPNQADSHLAGLVMKLQQELDFANEELAESNRELQRMKFAPEYESRQAGYKIQLLEEELEGLDKEKRELEKGLSLATKQAEEKFAPLERGLMLVQADKQRLGEENEQLRKDVESLTNQVDTDLAYQADLRLKIENLEKNTANIVGINDQQKKLWLEQIAEMKHNHSVQVAQWSDTVQGLMAQREQLEIERDALKKENEELRRILTEQFAFEKITTAA